VELENNPVKVKKLELHLSILKKNTSDTLPGLKRMHQPKRLQHKRIISRIYTWTTSFCDKQENTHNAKCIYVCI